MKRVLITGVFGYLGSQCLKMYKTQGCYVAGIGHAVVEPDHADIAMLDDNIVGPISAENLLALGDNFDIVVHCAGSGSVGKSLADPEADFVKTVMATQILLEFIKNHSPMARLVFTSSAAIYGNSYTSPIQENVEADAISPYGIHKDLAEQLCMYYSRLYGLGITVIRFFSIYGPGLKKQLLWDSCNKISCAAPSDTILFFGTGEEVRDWIEIHDALQLIEAAALANEPFIVVNGSTGIGTSVTKIINTLSRLLDSEATIGFNHECRPGDPQYLCGSSEYLSKLGWSAQIPVEQGLATYVEWYRAHVGR